jgi:hypothetical protein
MTHTNEALKLEATAAIDTLKFLGYTYHGGERWKPPLGECPAWLNEPAPVQEPVAWRWSESKGERWFDWTTDWSHHDKAKLMAFPIEYAYTTPPAAKRQWVGLTEDEREQHRDDWRSNIHDKEFRAIEAKLKEKNNG